MSDPNGSRLPDPKPDLTQLSTHVPPPLPLMAEEVVEPYPYPVFVKPSSHAQAAKASWIAPIIAVVLNYLLVASNTGRKTRFELLLGAVISTVFYAIGLFLSLYALMGVRAHGPVGIRTPAIVGLCINAVLLSVMLVVLLASHFG
ncbi:MAG: hypothetical protein QM770_23940 [Tepidisphaeraceae bacterium]